ncbi:MAG: glycine cleavage system protein GcvH [Deltaproteobacteria bacterium]|nr:glycine cleavage system protein GcvH [Deltaproteobacteria bacterium]
MNFPENLKYTTHDEWVSIVGGEATIGITAFAQDQLGELVHVELPKVGRQLAAGDVACEVESVKAVAEIYAPISGKVTDVNNSLNQAAESINSDPYGSWIYKIAITDPAEAAALMDSAAYRARIGK